MKWQHLMMVLMTGAVCLTAGMAWGGVRYVATGGGDGAAGTAGDPWRTVTYAVTNSITQDGDEIRVAAGLYEENPVVPATRVLAIRGGYDASTWTLDLAGPATILRSTNAASDVVTVFARTNTLSGFTLTGGRYGFYATNQTSGAGLYWVDHCVVSNNASHGLYNKSYRCALRIANSLIVRNAGDGIRSDVDNGQCAYEQLFDSCTIAMNGGNGTYVETTSAPRHSVVTNCIVAGNGGYAFGLAAASMRDCTVYGSLVYSNTLGIFRSTASGPWEGFLVANPRFAGENDFRLTAGSPAVGAGGTASGGATDLVGTTRTGAQDMGCYQSALAAVRLATVYVDATGDDANDGATPGTPKRTLDEALAFVAQGGEVVVAAGDYPSVLAFISVGSVTLRGAGTASTRLVGRPNAGCFGVVNASSTNALIYGFDISGGTNGVLVLGKGGGETLNVLKTVVSNCVVRGNGNGFNMRSSLARQKQSFIVTHCRIVSNTNVGVNSGGITGPILRNCLIASNGTDGVYLPVDQVSPEGYVDHCTIVDNGRHGVYVDNGNNPIFCYVRNSIVARNGGWGWKRSGASGNANKAGLLYVLFHGNVSGDFDDNGTSFYATGILTDDPGFVGAVDYHLALQSAAVGAGANLGYANDLDLTPRSGRYDLGCFQAAPEATGATRYPAVYVDSKNGNDINNGLSAGSAKATLAEGLCLTDTGGTCYLAAGDYVTRSLTIPRNNMRLMGAGPDVTILFKTNKSCSVLMDCATNTTLSGLTLRGGAYGLYFSPSGANRGLVENCTIESNSVGVYVLESTVLGRVYPVVTMDRCRVRGNTSNGVYALDTSSVKLRNCLVTKNTGIGINLPIDQVAPSPSLVDFSTVADNVGGGISWYGSYPGVLYIRSSVVANNSGMGVYYRKTTLNKLYVSSSLVYGNVTNFTGDAYISFDAGAITNQPALLKADYSLTDGSPCIDSATNLNITVDLLGTPRPQRGGYDMGAFELFRLGTVILIR